MFTSFVFVVTEETPQSVYRVITMPITCPHCNQHFPHSDTINSRHKAKCPGWQAQSETKNAPSCLCGHVATSLTQMKRHRQKCDVWKARDRDAVQMGRLAATLEANHGLGVDK